MALRTLDDDSEVWFTNPGRQAWLALESGARAFYFPTLTTDDTHLIHQIGDKAAIMVRAGRGEGDFVVMNRPYQDPAVLPVWHYGRHSLRMLDDLIDSPWGSHRPNDTFILAGETYHPNPTQEHRVVIEGVGGPIADDFLRDEVVPRQEQTNAVLHVTDSLPLATIMPLQLWSMSHTAWIAPGRPILPNGLEPVGDMDGYDLWFELLQTDFVTALATNQNLYSYNIKAILWASVNWHRATTFATAGSSAQAITLRSKRKPKDNWLCNTCTIQHECKFFRRGAVCAIPDQYPGELARQFQTRDSKSITKGMAALIAASIHRIEKRIVEEETDPEVGFDPNLTKAIKDTVVASEKLAKLVDPILAASGATRIQVAVGITPQPGPGRPGAEIESRQAATSRAVHGLMERGYTMDSINGELIDRFLRGEPIPALGTGE